MMIKKKLLVVASTFPRWENDALPPFVYELSRRLTDKFEVYVLAPHFKGAKKYELMEGMHVFRFQYFPERYQNLVCSGGAIPTLKKNKLTYLQVPFFFMAEFFSLLKLVRKIKPDVIHAHWIPQGFIAALIEKLTGVPYVLTSHGGDAFTYNGYLGRLFKKYTLRNAQAITTVSSEIRDTFLKLDSKLKISVISMGVDTNLFSPARKQNPTRNLEIIGKPLLLFVGRLTEKKGIHNLINAMPEIIQKFPHCKLLIIGSGELEEQLKYQARSLSLSKHVTFVGAVKNRDLPKYYSIADIFVAPFVTAKSGDKEGMPVILMEALASGIPAICGDFKGSSQIILSGKTGFVIKDQKNWVFLINEILKHKTRMSKYCRTVAVRNYDWNKIAKDYKEVLL